MTTLSNKIDFAVILTAQNANPNGDPQDNNRPRTTFDGKGEISDVAIKRKIRNRLMDEGHTIFVQSDDRRMENDNYPTLQQRAKSEISKEAQDNKSDKKYIAEACAKWIDVRSFGQVFAFQGESRSVGIRGPVSIHPAFSVSKVVNRISSIQITKSVSGSGTGDKKSSDTMGMKHRVDHGVYVFYGSLNPQLASKTGFSDDDAQAIKEALRTLFRNDASSARPEGSMEVYKLFWWEHNSPNGQYSSAKVHRLLNVKPAVDEPKRIEDYDISLDDLDDLKCEVIEGE